MERTYNIYYDKEEFYFDTDYHVRVSSVYAPVDHIMKQVNTIKIYTVGKVDGETDVDVIEIFKMNFYGVIGVDSAPGLTSIKVQDGGEVLIIKGAMIKAGIKVRESI